MIETTVIASTLAALFLLLTTPSATADDGYKKICVVGGNARVLDSNGDANSCRQLAVSSQAQEYQIGCRDSENDGTSILAKPFSITDKAARITSAKLAANTQNTATPEQFTKCAAAWGSH